MIEVGQVYPIEITGISHQGFGVGRIQQVVVFVPHALLGETVSVRVSDIKKNMAHGTLEAILQPSEARVQPACAQSALCGGCELQHAQYAHQLAAKRQIVQDAITKLARADVTVQPVLGMTDPWRYRNKGVFHAAYLPGQVKLGFHQTGSHDVIAAEDCRLFSPQMNAVLRFLEEAIQQHTKTHYIQKVMLRESRATGQIMVVLVTADHNWLAPQLTQALTQAFPQIISIYHNINTNPKLMLGKAFGLLFGEPFLIDTIGELRFQISPQSFFQVNNEQAWVLYRQVLELAQLQGHEQVIDAYCGIGTISLFLAQRAAQVIGVESVSQAVKDANTNARMNNITNCRFITAKAEEWLPKWTAKGNPCDLVVIDPPRKGCDKKLLYALTESKPPKIIYVSCEPSTMARDIRCLTENGYELQHVQPVDLFAQSWHVESVALMSRVAR